MKEIKLTDIGTLKNELAKYRKGKRLGIPQFNQTARLAWLGKLVLSPLDPEDPECKAYLLYVPALDSLAGQLLEVDEELLSRIHVLDGEQGDHLAAILREGLEARVQELKALNQRDFYFGRFFDPEPRK